MFTAANMTKIFLSYSYAQKPFLPAIISITIAKIYKTIMDNIDTNQDALRILEFLPYKSMLLQYMQFTMNPTTDMTEYVIPMTKAGVVKGD